MTFSIVAWDSATQMTGVAVATKHLAVGALVPHAKATVGAIATQGQTNPLLGICSLQLLEHGVSAEDTLQLLLQDDLNCHQRQLHLVDRRGHTAAWTGEDCVGWAGHLTYPCFSVAGNMLVGEQVLVAMADTYQAKAEMEFCDRLLHALEAGEAAGGGRGPLSLDGDNHRGDVEPCIRGQRDDRGALAGLEQAHQILVLTPAFGVLSHRPPSCHRRQPASG